MDKIIVGIIEKIKIKGKKDKEVLAKIDTGAQHNSINMKLASELKLGPIVRTAIIRNAHGKVVRSVVRATIEIKGKTIESEFNLSNREHMKYHVLIGMNVLKEGFLIDPSKIKENEVSNN
ncbi:ATP-dependent zinc protease [Candidatus Woesearchaeota archaeon]|nr:ATP-dependent zinc protease [Candidatus Woesearchaeota archaeon]